MSVVTTTITSEGQAMADTYQLMSLDISKEVNRISRAQLVLIDGDPASGEFPISDSNFFDPGNHVEINLRYEGDQIGDVTVFEGIVVRHSASGSTEGLRLVIELKDKAVKLTQVRNTRVFEKDKTDSRIIKDLLGVAGLKEGAIAETTSKHEEIVQYNATDWDFIVSRADINGCLVAVDDGKVWMVKMREPAQSDHKFKLGIDEIYNFEFELNAESQFSDVKAVAWDTKTNKPTELVTGEALASQIGEGPRKADGKALSEKIGFGDYVLSHPVPLVSEEQKAWADARVARDRLAMIRGRVAVRGDASITLLQGIELNGFGKRFVGIGTITGVSHSVSLDGWETNVQYGLSPDWFCNEPDISAAASAGLLPPVSGLQIGIVSAFEEDETGEFRVRVLLPAITANDPEGGKVWARLATPDGGKDRGYFFRPEPDDEVVVGFFNDDPRQAVILGAMFGSVNTLPVGINEPSEANDEKAIVSRSGSTFGFIDAEKPSVFIETPAHNKILFSDDQEAILISDQHGNTIMMNKDGFVINSVKDFEVTAKGKITFNGSEVDLK